MKILSVNNTIKNSVSYVLYSENLDYCILVDCGEFETLSPILENIGKKVYAVLLTHGHMDHIMGLKQLIEQQPMLKVCTLECGHEEIQDAKQNMSQYHDMAFTIENYNKQILNDGEILQFEGFPCIEVIATPGHDTSCLSYKIGIDLFTGDSYIPEIKVFTKLPRGNKELAIKSLDLLLSLEKHGFKIHCGHHSFENRLK